MSAVIDFVPQSLIAIRQRIQELHPDTAKEPPAPEPGLLAALQPRIVAASANGRLDRLADALSPREVRAVVGGLEHWADLGRECTIIIRRRATTRLLPLLWGGWQRRPDIEALQTILLEVGEGFGWANAVAEPYADVAADWVRAPGPGIQRYLDGQGLGASDLPDLVGRPVRPDSNLARLVREAVLTNGSLRQLHEDHNSIIGWQRELTPEKAILFGRHYLSTMPDGEWAEPIIGALHDRYGTPKKPKVERFWEPLSEDIKEAFQRRYIRKRIRDEFHGDHDREQFWYRWAHEIADLHKGWAGRTRYAEIEFESFVVFEFFETGNAAYFYTPEDRLGVKRGAGNTPGDYKERIHYPFLRGDNRLLHMPGWWPRGDRMITRWIRR